MDSSFLTSTHIGLSLFAIILFFKMIIQFGLPNHPARFVSYVVGLCVSGYFVGLAATDLNFLSPWVWMKWRALPLIAGSLCLLLQIIMLTAGSGISLVQQKVISRLPLMAALLCFAFFAQYADKIMLTFLFIAAVFLIISVKKARYQKRTFLKMLTMFMLHLGFVSVNIYVFYVIAHVILFFVIFYIFMFEHSFGLSALVDDFKQSLEGDFK